MAEKVEVAIVGEAVHRILSNVSLFSFQRTEMDRTTLENSRIVPAIKERD